MRKSSLLKLPKLLSVIFIAMFLMPIPQQIDSCLGPSQFVEQRGFGSGSVDSFAINPNGNTIAIGYTSSIHIIDAHKFITQKEILLTEFRSTALTWSPDGMQLATYIPAIKSIRIWASQSWKITAEISSKNEVNQDAILLSWSPNGKFIAGLFPTSLQVWSVEQDSVILKIDTSISYDNTSHAVVWSPDGQYIALGLPQKEIRVWQTKTWQLIQTLPMRNASPDTLAWSKQGRLAVASVSGQLDIFNTTTWLLTYNIQGRPWQPTLAWSPTDSFLAVGGTDGVYLLNASNGSQFRYFAQNTRVDQVDWFTDGTKLVSLGRDRTLYIWDITSSQLLFKQTSYFTSADFAWSPDSKSIAISVYRSGPDFDPSPEDNALEVWDVPTQKITQSIIIPDTFTPVTDITWSPNGVSAAMSADTKFYTLDMATSSLRKYPESNGFVRQLRWSSDSQQLASVSDGSPTANSPPAFPPLGNDITIWDTKTGKKNSHTDDVITEKLVVYNNNLWYTIIEAGNNVLEVRELETGHELVSLNVGYILETVEVSKSMKFLVGSLSSDNIITFKVVDMISGQVLLTVPGKYVTDIYTDIYHFSPKGNVLAISDQAILNFWEIATNKVGYGAISTKSGSYIQAFDISPDETCIAVVDSERKLELFSTKTSNIYELGSHITRVKWSPDGKHLGTLRDDGTFSVWE